MQSIFPLQHLRSKCGKPGRVPQKAHKEGQENKNANLGEIQWDCKILYQKENKSFVSIFIYFTLI